VAEAMACGIPVIGFEAGGIPEMIDHKKTGYLVKPKDVDGLNKGIDWVLSAYEHGMDFSKYCRRKALNEYSSERQTQVYKGLYKRIYQRHLNEAFDSNGLCQPSNNPLMADIRETQDNAGAEHIPGEVINQNATGLDQRSSKQGGLVNFKQDLEKDSFATRSINSKLSQQPQAITVATSLAPRDIESQAETLNSWKKLGFHVASLNCQEEIDMLQASFPEVQFIRTKRNAQKIFGKPYVYFDDFLEFFKKTDTEISGIVNSDIFLFANNGIIPYIIKETKNSLVYGSRVEIQSLDNLNGEFYDRGFDFFFFDKAILSCFPNSEACIGVTWWDYWAPMIPALKGIPLKKMASPFAFHLKHSIRWDDKQWHYMGKQISNYLFGRRCENKSSPNKNDPLKLFDAILSNSTHALFENNSIDPEKKAKLSYGMLPRFGISILAFLEKISAQIHYEGAIDDSASEIHAGNNDNGKKIAQDLNQQGEALLKKGDFNKAMPLFLKALEMEPMFPTPHSNLGILHWQTGNISEALKQFKAALEIEPKDEAAALFCGNVLMKNGKYAEARQLFSFYLFNNPANLEIAKILADLEKNSSPEDEMTDSKLSISGSISDGMSLQSLDPVIPHSPEKKTGAKARQIIRESALAHKWLDGLQGLEIGPSAQNPFGLNTRNVGMPDDIYEQDQITRAGKAAKLDIIATAEDIPVPDESEDFILASHIIEHCPDFIKALIEWFRIVKPGGYIFMITPHRYTSLADAGRPLTSWTHIFSDYINQQTSEKEPEAGLFLHCHYHVFNFDLMKQFVDRVFGDRITLVDSQKMDDKDGSGFTLVYQKKRLLRETFPWQVSSGKSIVQINENLNFKLKQDSS
jgi:tetratricopeptide (TPR) repeat protein